MLSMLRWAKLQLRKRMQCKALMWQQNGFSLLPTQHPSLRPRILLSPTPSNWERWHSHPEILLSKSIQTWSIWRYHQEDVLHVQNQGRKKSAGRKKLGPRQNFSPTHNSRHSLTEPRVLGGPNANVLKTYNLDEKSHCQCFLWTTVRISKIFMSPMMENLNSLCQRSHHTPTEKLHLKIQESQAIFMRGFGRIPLQGKLQQSLGHTSLIASILHLNFPRRCKPSHKTRPKETTSLLGMLGKMPSSIKSSSTIYLAAKIQQQFPPRK